MLYEIYQNKIRKRARVLSKIVRALPVIVPTVTITVCAIVAVLALKGTVMDIQCPSEIAYGESFVCQAKAFWSDVGYEYSTDNGITWSEECPTRAGEYLVRVAGQTLFDQTRYSKPVAFTIAPKAIDVTVAESSIPYGENAPTVSASLVNGDVISCDDFVYTNPLSGDKTSGNVAFVFDVTPKAQSVHITDAQGNDVTSSYTLNCVSSKLAIEKRPITVTVADAQHVYDDLPFTFDTYELSFGTLYEKDVLIATFEASLTDVGSIPNQPGLTVVTEDGQDRTAYYVISSVFGTLSVEKRPLVITTQSGEYEYTGEVIDCTGIAIYQDSPLVDTHTLVLQSAPEPIEVGEYLNTHVYTVQDAQGNDKTENYSIFVQEGTIRITPKPVTVITPSGEWEYDDADHAASDYTVDGVLLQHSYEIELPTVHDVGMAENLVAPVVIMDGQGNNVTHNYALTYDIGTLTVTPKPVFVSTQSGEWEYDGLEHTAGEYVVDGVLPSHLYEIELPVVQDAGTVENLSGLLAITDGEGKSTVHNYAITYDIGTLTVTPKPVHITTPAGVWEYDDRDHRTNDHTVEGVLPTQTYALQTVSIRNVGVVENGVQSFVVFDKKGNDTTHNYAVTHDLGMLTVTPRPLHVITNDSTWMYDGEDHSLYNYSLDGLIETHDANCTVERIRNVGTKQNTLVIHAIYNQRGEDVLKNYDVTYTFGMLSVTKRPLIFETGSASWIYDSWYHSTTAYDVTGLVGHHVIEPESTVEIKNAGSAENAYTIRILSANEPQDGMQHAQGLTDVTENYDITYRYGTLEVLKRSVSLFSADASKIYDATPLEMQTVYVTSPLGIADNDELIVSDWTWIIDAGEIPNSFTYEILDKTCTHANASSPEDRSCCVATENYDLSVTFGTLIVYPRPISIKPTDAEKVYDDTPLTATEIELLPDSPYPLVEDHIIVPGIMVGSMIDVGTADSYVSTYAVLDEDGNDVTRNYVTHESQSGTLTVTPRQITIYTESAEKHYDRTPLTQPNFGVRPEQVYDLVAGHYVEFLDVIGSQTAIGESENSVNQDGTRIRSATRDVTHNYEITYEYGTLKVLPNAVIYVTSASDWKYYDGTPLTNPSYEFVVAEGELRADLGHELIVLVEGSGTAVGTYPNTMYVMVWDAEQGDVTDYYRIMPEEGELEIRNPQTPPDDTLPGGSWGKIMTDKDDYLYLKEQVFGNYSGSKWSAAPEYWKTLPGGFSYDYLTSFVLANSGQPLTNAYAKDLLIFMLPYYMTEGGDYEVQTSDTVYSGIMSNFTVPYYNMPDAQNGYAFLQGNLGEWAAYEQEYREFVYMMYLTVDDETREFMQGLIDEQGFDASDPKIVQKVASYIQLAAVYDQYYDLALESEPNVAIAFLRDYKTGVCRHYATAATLMFRTLGIPARYVQGFAMATSGGEYVDLPEYGHAWVEVYIDGVGWVQVEVTGFDENGNQGIPNNRPGGNTGDQPAEENPEESRVIKIVPKYQWKHYDGEPLFATGEIDDDRVLLNLLEKGYTYTVSVVGSQTEVGVGTSTVTSFRLYDPSGNDVTDQFEYEYLEGKLEVLPLLNRVIRVYLYQLQKYYNGTPLSFEQDDYEIIEIPQDMELDLKLHISLTGVGSISLSEINMNRDEYITYKVYYKGKDVTNQCTVIFEEIMHSESYLPIRVDPSMITVISASQTKIDDGTPLTNSSVSLFSGLLVTGHRIVADVVGIQEEEGSSENFIQSVRILDENDNDVTDYYEISKMFGKLTILPADT